MQANRLLPKLTLILASQFNYPKHKCFTFYQWFFYINDLARWLLALGLIKARLNSFRQGNNKPCAQSGHTFIPNFTVMARNDVITEP
jgi:hypothetical protein